MTSDRVLSDLDTLGRALHDVSALLRGTEAQAALDRLRTGRPADEAQRDATRRVWSAARAVRAELDSVLGALGDPAASPG